MQDKTQTQAVTSAVDPMTPGSLLANVGGMLALVLIVIAVCAWIARRIGLARPLSKGTPALSVVASHALGQRARVVVIEMNEKRILLGVTATQINCLASFDKPQDEAEPAIGAGADDFQPLLMKILKQRKVESTK